MRAFLGSGCRLPACHCSADSWPAPRPAALLQAPVMNVFSGQSDMFYKMLVVVVVCCIEMEMENVISIVSGTVKINPSK